MCVSIRSLLSTGVGGSPSFRKARTTFVISALHSKTAADAAFHSKSTNCAQKPETRGETGEKECGVLIRLCIDKAAILKSFGRLSVEPFAQKLFLEFKTRGFMHLKDMLHFILDATRKHKNFYSYHEKLMTPGFKVTDKLLIASVGAYMKCGHFEKSKQLMVNMLDERIPMNLNVLRNSYVHHAAISDSMDGVLIIRNKTKRDGCNHKPTTIMNLIENFKNNGKTGILLCLLDELKHSPYHWIDGCCRIILSCVLNKNLNLAIDLLRRLHNTFSQDDPSGANFYDEVFSYIADLDPSYLDIGVEILKVIKNEFGRPPTRKSLDFMLCVCIEAKNLVKAQFIWNEYKSAGFTYNSMIYERMYRALLAGGDSKSAKILLHTIPKGTSHSKLIIKYTTKHYLEGNKKDIGAKTRK